MTATIDRHDKFRWLSYSYRYKNEESVKKFGEWVVMKDWTGVVQAVGSDTKANLYQNEINWAIENFFPLRTTKRRTTDPPWIDNAVRRLIRRRKRIFKDSGGRTLERKKAKKKVEQLIAKRRKVYQDSQREALLAADADRNFFRNTKNYMSKERPPPFDVMNLFPGKAEAEVAETLAVHFNRISQEFVPLDHRRDIPRTFSRPIQVLEVHEVAGRLKSSKNQSRSLRVTYSPIL